MKLYLFILPEHYKKWEEINSFITTYKNLFLLEEFKELAQFIDNQLFTFYRDMVWKIAFQVFFQPIDPPLATIQRMKLCGIIIQASNKFKIHQDYLLKILQLDVGKKFFYQEIAQFSFFLEDKVFPLCLKLVKLMEARLKHNALADLPHKSKL